MSIQENRLLSRRSFAKGLMSAGAAILGVGAGVLPLETAHAPSIEKENADNHFPTLNMRDFIIPDSPDRVRLNGSHKLTTVVGDDEMFVRKWGSTEHFELLRWDDNYIYLILDRSPQRTYSINGKWLKVNMRLHETLDEKGTIEWFDRSCKSIRIDPYTYKNTLIEHDLYNFGGDVKIQETAVLEYLPYTPHGPGNPERFYYTKQFGLTMWEELDPNKKIKHQSIFNIVEQLERPPQSPPFDIVCKPTMR